MGTTEISMNAASRRMMSYFDDDGDLTIEIGTESRDMSAASRRFLFEADTNDNDRVDLDEMRTALSRWDGGDDGILTLVRKQRHWWGGGYDVSGGWNSAVRGVLGLDDDADLPNYFEPYCGGRPGISGGPGRNGRLPGRAEWAML